MTASAPFALATQAPAPPTERAPSALPAIGLAIAAVGLFSCSDMMAKLLRQTLPAVEIAWMRYVVFMAFAVLLAARRRFVDMATPRAPLQVLRGLTVVASALLFIAGLGRLPMAEATAISFVSPAFITALSIPILGEVVGVRRWAAVVAGLVGVLIVVRPGSGAVQTAALLPLASSACWAVAMVVTRRMGTADRAETTLLWTAASGLIALTAAVPFGFVAPRPAEIAIGLALGLCASLGQYLVVLAYRRAAASVLAPFSYVQLLTSTLFGYLVFAAVPDAMTFLGAAIVMLSGLYTAHRERVRARA